MNVTTMYDIDCEVLQAAIDEKVREACETIGPDIGVEEFEAHDTTLWAYQLDNGECILVKIEPHVALIGLAIEGTIQKAVVDNELECLDAALIKLPRLVVSTDAGLMIVFDYLTPDRVIDESDVPSCEHCRHSDRCFELRDPIDCPNYDDAR